MKVTGTTAINTIIPGIGPGQSQFLILIPVDGSVILGTSGNILDRHYGRSESSSIHGVFESRGKVVH